MNVLVWLDDNIAWGVPMIILIMATGILLTCRIKVLQFRKLGKALKYMVKNEEEGEGEVTSFGALSTALAATIGTGNIVGVATAIMAGGPGALFWMIIAACFGMATKYAEGLLAVKYRTLDTDGHALGGPFLYIEKGMGEKWKWLGKAFAVFATLAGLLGIGTMTQTNGVVSAINRVADPNMEHVAFILGTADHPRPITWATIITAFIVAVIVALVLIGGIKRIATVTSLIVPFMAIIYVAVALAILITHIGKIPEAIGIVVSSAFGARAAAGGALGAMMIAVQKGVARGIFSNEAGLGSAPIAAAAATTKEPVRQGLVTMTGTFIDTIIICTMTGLTIMVTGAYATDLGGADVTIYAFGKGLPWSDQMGGIVLAACLAMFAFTTILGWNYYSERSLEYLIGRKKGALLAFRWLWVLTVFCGPFLALDAVWTLADILNGLMALPNLIALIALSGVVAYETKSYFDRLDKGEIKE